MQTKYFRYLLKVIENYNLSALHWVIAKRLANHVRQKICERGSSLRI